MTPYERMKNDMLNHFKAMGENVKNLLDPDTFVRTMESDPSSNYRKDFYNALLSLNLSPETTAKIAMKIQLKVNTYDAEFSKSFCSNVLLPMMNVMIIHKDLTSMGPYLSMDDHLLSVAKDCSLELMNE